MGVAGAGPAVGAVVEVAGESLSGGVGEQDDAVAEVQAGIVQVAVVQSGQLGRGQGVVGDEGGQWLRWSGRGSSGVCG